MIQYFTKKINNKKGFTLVELIIVVAILGVLAMLAVPKFTKSRVDAAIAAHNANVRTLESAATLAVSEGNTDFEWEKREKKTEDNIDENDWENYLQDWPEVPSGLNSLGDEYEGGPTDEGEEYEVVVEGGKITVTPEKIIKK